MAQALDLGVYDQFVFGDALKNTSLIEAIGAASLAGMYGAGTADPPDSESSAAWKAAWIDAYGGPPEGSYVREVYDATIALALAAQAANSIDGGAIRDQLRTHRRRPGPAGHRRTRGHRQRAGGRWPTAARSSTKAPLARSTGAPTAISAKATSASGVSRRTSRSKTWRPFRTGPDLRLAANYDGRPSGHPLRVTCFARMLDRMAACTARA